MLTTRYLFGYLRLACLRSLQRDLQQGEMLPAKISLVLDLLEFTYSETGPVEPGNERTLRELMIAFVATRSRELVSYGPRF